MVGRYIPNDNKRCWSVLIILCSDKLFPVLGFGAKLPGGSVSHEFAVVS